MCRCILRLAKRDDIRLFVSASSITDVYYIVRRQVADASIAWQKLNDLLQIIDVAPVGKKEIQAAICDRWHDFEDAVQSESASSVGAKYIITRNIKDFSDSAVPAVTPQGFLQNIKQKLSATRCRARHGGEAADKSGGGAGEQGGAWAVWGGSIGGGAAMKHSRMRAAVTLCCDGEAHCKVTERRGGMLPVIVEVCFPRGKRHDKETNAIREI